MLRDLDDKNRGLKVLRSGRVGDAIPPCNGDEIVISDIVTRRQADRHVYIQVPDPDLGLIDLSYVPAWELGKTLALEDPSVTAVLARLRTKIHNDSLEAARKDIFRRLRISQAVLGTLGDDVHEHSVLTDTDCRSTYVPISRIKADVADLVDALNHINDNVHSSGI
ncbi:hypothetical protein ColLi_11291 [Colletotrichum liriopes]|uniref:Uncharacterized protein n=1 Tax=Colletotrichum liriopes TaxID=708192 RepID=A0AA37LYF9_9PEZI|nr:hypothetical protein ColLi_11291 [Colletotrichum liriopes]